MILMKIDGKLINKTMKLKELIKDLQEYNLEADINVIVHCKTYLFSLSFGDGEGCTKENCDNVSFYVDELCTNETEG